MSEKNLSIPYSYKNVFYNISLRYTILICVYATIRQRFVAFLRNDLPRLTEPFAWCTIKIFSKLMSFITVLRIRCSKLCGVLLFIIYKRIQIKQAQHLWKKHNIYVLEVFLKIFAQRETERELAASAHLINGLRTIGRTHQCHIKYILCSRGPSTPSQAYEVVKTRAFGIGHYKLYIQKGNGFSVFLIFLKIKWLVENEKLVVFQWLLIF